MRISRRECAGLVLLPILCRPDQAFAGIAPAACIGFAADLPYWNPRGDDLPCTMPRGRTHVAIGAPVADWYEAMI